MKRISLHILIPVALFLLVSSICAQQDNPVVPPLKLISSRTQTNNFQFVTEKIQFNKVNQLKLKKTSDIALKESKKSGLHPVRFTIVVSTMTLGWLGMHIYYNQTWWKNRAHYFKYDQDTYYARNVDKLSHIYTANLIAVGGAQIFEWTGMNPTLSLVVGSATAIAYETYIEINDGFSPNWGFDWGDMAGNFIGALWPIAQKYAKPLKAINFKWSFEPAWLNKKLRNYPDLLDDYTSMKFWITFNPYYVLPKKAQKWYPAFLGIGLGVNLQNASHTTGATNAYKEYYLGFDIDINQLPGKSDFLIKLKKILNFYHIPTPGIKIYKNTIWYGLLF